MKAPAPEFEQLAVVCIGSFNPKIFQPEWFAKHKLITEKESEAANIEMISAHATKIVVQDVTLSCVHLDALARFFGVPMWVSRVSTYFIYSEYDNITNVAQPLNNTATKSQKSHHSSLPNI